MPDNNLTDNNILSELYFLIAHFLNNGPFKDTAQNLIRQLEQHRVLPPRIDWTGREHHRSFQEMSENLTHVPSNFLLQMCNQLKSMIQTQSDLNFSNLSSLFGIGQYSVLQDVQRIKNFKENQANKTSNMDVIPKDFYLNYHSNNKNFFNNSKQIRNGGISIILNLNKRQLDGKLPASSIIQPEFFRSINLHKRTFGHLSAVYCVCFDRTGRYILTGADDNLIKTWSAYDGRLLATFRGHEKEISDIDINFENTLLASGSCDKTIRIWNLKTTECVFILQSHTAMVTSIEFSPYCRGTTRWLASSGNDGVICFWYWNSETLDFNPKPRRFIEKSRPGSQILCLSFSAGGLFLAAGSNDHAIRVYCFENGDPSKICELESHTNWVDSIQYANKSARFLSGSKDGTARIWSFESKQWKNILIDGSKTLQKTEANEFLNQDICKRYSVTMIAWNSDDSLVITAQNNFIIKVWNSNDAQLVHELKGHNDEIFVLEAHPKDPRILLSAGHDGHVILWNMLTGKMLKKFYNRIENEGHGCLFDTKWSPNCDMFASTDSHGNLTIYGFGSDDKFKKVPNQLFFHTDYRPLMRDANGYVVDEQTQQPPHSMPPPFLVDADGNPFNSDLQRLVPGREKLTDAQLIPHIITNENGLSEIIGDREENEENQDQVEIEQIRQRNRRTNIWVKNVIQPIDLVLLNTSELDRNSNLEQEEHNYKKELKEIELYNQKGSVYIYRDGENSRGNLNTVKKRGRGRSKKSDTNLLNGSAENTNTLMDYDEDTMEDQIIDIDDDSNTRHSNTDALPSTSIDILISSRSSNNYSSFRQANSNNNSNNNNNNTNNNTNRTRRTVFVENDLLTDSDQNSDYSDWAEQDGRKTLRSSTRHKITRQKTNRRGRKKILKIDDDDDENDEANQEIDNEDEEEIKGKTKTTLSKKLTKLISDEDDNDDEVKKETSDADIDDEEDMEEYSESDEDEQYDEDYEENDENIDPNRPCTSRAAESRSTKSPRKKTKKYKKRGRPPLNSKLSDSSHKQNLNNNKTIPRSNSKASKQSPSKENQIEIKPSEWLSSTKPRKSPYVPQIEDEVVYFRQGHELYVHKIKSEKYYEIDDKNLPWSQFKQINVQEFCKIIDIQIEIEPIRLVTLKLQVIERHSSKSTGQQFSVKYHDIDGVADFIILKQIYDKAIERNWKPKDRFRSLIDDNWYIGTIENKKPFQEDYPESQFQCLSVLWDTSDKEELSPWDLEPLSGVNSRKTKPVSVTAIPTIGEIRPVTEEEFKSLLYVPKSDEWHHGNRDLECDRLLEGFAVIEDMSCAEPFKTPVDLVEFPNYTAIVAYPIDLNTIRQRIENRYYRRLKAVEWDVKKIVEDAFIFNEPDSDICRDAKLLTDVLVEFINDSDCLNPQPIYKRLNVLSRDKRACRNKQTKNEPTTSVTTSNTTAKLRFNLRSRTHNFEDNMNNFGSSMISYKWRDDCLKLTEDIHKNPDSLPFRCPVDIEEYPHYYDLIHRPMDFGTIRSHLKSNTYDNNFKKFQDECNLVFQNSKTFNTNKSSEIYKMTDRLFAFYNERIEIIKKRYEASENEKSKYGKSRRSRLQCNYNEDNLEKLNSFTNLRKEEKSHLTNNNYQSSNNINNISTESIGPSTSGYATRSNKKIKSLNSNSNHNYDHNTDSLHSNQDLNTSLFSKSDDVLNRSYLDEDTQMALLEDNVEYDLNEDYQGNKNSKLTRNFSNKNELNQTNQNNTFSNFNLKIKQNKTLIEESNSSRPTTSTCNNNMNNSKSEPQTLSSFLNNQNNSTASNSQTNKKSRLNRADSSTILSHTDTVENDNSNLNNKKSKNNKKTQIKKNKIETDEENEDENEVSHDEKTESEFNETNEFSNQDESEEEYYEEDEDYDEELVKSKKLKKNKNVYKKKIKKEEEYEDEDQEDDDDDDDDEEDEDNEDDDFNVNSKKKKLNKKGHRLSTKDKKSSKKSGRPIRSCRRNLDDKENDNEHNENNTKTKTRINDKKSSIKESNTGTYSTRSSKRARNKFYGEFTSSEEEYKTSEDEDNYKSKKVSKSRKKPRFSSSENLNV